MTTALLFLALVTALSAAGLGMSGLIGRGAGALGPAHVLPLGACTAVLVTVPAARLFPLGQAGAPIVALVLALVAAAGGTRLTRRLRAADPARRRRALRTGGLTLAGATAAGAAFLIPVFAAGFPTTLADGNHDGWHFAAHAEWLQEHVWGRLVAQDTGEPFSAIARWVETWHLPVGVDTLAGTAVSLSGLHGFAVVGVTGALAVPVAACGWITLARVVGAGRPAHWTVPFAGLAVASPLLVFQYAENFMANLWGSALWPFVMATALHALRRGDLPSAATAAIALGGLLSLYPAILPWTGVALAAVAVLAVIARRDEPGGIGAACRRGAVTAAVALGLTVLIAPLQVLRAIDFTRFAQGIGDGAPVTLEVGGTAAQLVGAQAIRAGSLDAVATAAALMVCAVFAVALLLPTRGPRPRVAPLVLGAAVLLSTVVIYERYRGRGFGYLMEKAVSTGGGLLAGLALVGLVAAVRPRSAVAFAVALAALAAVWVPVDRHLLHRTSVGLAGMHPRDRELGDTLAALGADDVLLVEGAAETLAQSFQLRQMAAYFAATELDGTVEGLGSTHSYLTQQPTLIPPGAPEWRPARPWSTVLRLDSGPFSGRRHVIGRIDWYTVERAPLLDATPFGAGWYADRRDGDGVHSWSTGPVRILVSNGRDRPVRANVRMRLRSWRRPRTVRIDGGGTTTVVTVAPTGLTEVLHPVDLTAGSVTDLTLTPAPDGERGPARNPGPLALRVQDVEVRARG